MHPRRRQAESLRVLPPRTSRRRRHRLTPITPKENTEHADQLKRKSDPEFPGWFIAAWLFCALLGLGVTGLLIWAVIRLVNHYT